MKIIDGTNAILGRLASYAAKEALKGEEVVIVNCDKVIVLGNKKNIIKEFQEKRKKVGSSQKGPKYSKKTEMIVKRTIRGMLPNFRFGRGKEAFKRIKCYSGLPEEFKDKKKIVAGKEKKTKFVYLSEIFK
ncbi:MAG: 50S ribosomal protein L13 [Candidatus Pacearchaeota archaeon]|nr:MAG: 50S ribosomal protein L13 [Candidatus Pacearchaeota archaeon]